MLGATCGDGEPRTPVTTTTRTTAVARVSLDMRRILPWSEMPFCLRIPGGVIHSMLMKWLAATSALVTLILLPDFIRSTEPSATLLAAQTAPPDAVAADPARYSVLYENDVAQMIRVKYQAGARSVMHSHPAGCAIFYKDAALKATSSTGEVRTRQYRAGDVSCGDGNSHITENVGPDTEFVQVHLKNRKTFDHLQTGRSLVYPARLKAPDP